MKPKRKRIKKNILLAKVREGNFELSEIGKRERNEHFKQKQLKAQQKLIDSGRARRREKCNKHMAIQAIDGLLERGKCFN